MTSAATWNAGWYRFAHRINSPNFGPRPPGLAVDLVVIHSISLPPGQYGGSEVQDFFTNQLDHSAHPYFQKLVGVEVSAHFFIRRAGELLQFVSCDARAWHAGVSSHQGRSNCNDFSVGIELEGLEGDAFEDAQYETLCSLCTDLARAYPIAHIAGHEHIAPARKADPGAGFAWSALQKSLGWPLKYFP